MANPDARLTSFPPAVRLRIAAGLIEHGQLEQALALVSSVQEDLAVVVHIQSGERPVAQSHDDDPTP